jgi:hypothetical protein
VVLALAQGIHTLRMLMPLDLEILLPLRNPPEVFRATVDSLINQTDRDFSVVISDNHSTHGGERFDDAVFQLTAAKIATRLIRPPEPLQRVEHWNWLHFASTATWLKPLFAGDSLEADYVAKVKQAALSDAHCKYVYCGHILHREREGTTTPVIGGWSGGYRSPEEMSEVVVRYGLQFGPPSCAAYMRDAFIAVGGYHTGLPIVADSLFFCSLARRFGALGLAEPLLHFRIHAERFSDTLSSQSKATARETLTYYSALHYHAWTEGQHVSFIRRLRVLLRETRSYLLRR